MRVCVQLCLPLCNPIGPHRIGRNWSDLASTHRLWPARLLRPWDYPGKNLEQATISSSRGLPSTGMAPKSLGSPALAGGFFTSHTNEDNLKRSCVLAKVFFIIWREEFCLGTNNTVFKYQCQSKRKVCESRFIHFHLPFPPKSGTNRVHFPASEQTHSSGMYFFNTYDLFGCTGS